MVLDNFILLYNNFITSDRYDIPEPFTELNKPAKQEALPGLEGVSEGAVRALEVIVDKIQEKYNLTHQDETMRELVFGELKELVSRHLDPLITPLWFGSSRNGLVLNTSDMDITLDVSKVDPVDPASLLDSMGKAVSTY